MEKQELRLECLKMALDYAKYYAQHTNHYLTKAGILDAASSFYQHIEKDEQK